MDTIETHRTFLFLDELDGSDRTPSSQCRKVRDAAPVGVNGDVLPISIEGELILDFEFQPGADSDVSEGGSQEPGKISIENIGRDPQIVWWDGKAGALQRFEAMTFPEMKPKTMVNWKGQCFEAFSTPWENQHSPMVNYNTKLTPVVDSCGMVIGYFQQGVSTATLYTTSEGEIYHSHLYGSHTDGKEQIGGKDIWMSTAGQVKTWSESSQTLTAEHYAQMYHERIPNGNKADILTDIDGYVVAINMYLDPPPPPATGFWDSPVGMLLGFVLPQPPSAECLPGGSLADTDECALENAMFMLDFGFLFIDILSFGMSAMARKAVMKVLRVATKARAIKALKGATETALRTAKVAEKAGQLALDAPKVARVKPTVHVPTASGKKPVRLLAAEASDKKSNFMHAELGKKTGMTHMAIRDIRYKVKKLGVRVRFRPAGTARKLRKRGAIPKWEELKMKTINDDDIVLGAAKDGKGKPGYFEPKKPDPALEKTDPERYKRLMKRYEQRKTEFKELAEKVKKYQKDGDIVVENGVVKDGATGKDIAGDYDIYEITDKTGKRITPDDPKYAKIMKDLEGRRIGAQHGAHVDWKPTDPFEIKIKEEIVQRHRTSEPLYEFREDGSIWEMFAD